MILGLDGKSPHYPSNTPIYLYTVVLLMPQTLASSDTFKIPALYAG